MPKAKIRVRVNFNRDADFTDANEDITADVLEMKYTQGKDLLKQRAEASVLELLLDNNDHRYSPSLTTSALYPNVLPSPDIWAEIGYPMDDFDAADGTTLSSRKPSHDDLFAAWEGDTGDFDVISNKLRTPVSGDFTAVLDFGETDCFAAVDFTWQSAINDDQGLIIRWTDANNYLMVRGGSNNVLLHKVDAGTISALVSQTHVDKDGNTLTWNAGEEHKLAAEMHGDIIRVFIDDVLQFSHTTTFNNTATKHGVGGKNTQTGIRWDNFGGWRSVFFGRIDVIEPRPEIGLQYCYIRSFDDMERLGVHQTYKTAPTGGSVTAKAIIDVILNAANANSQNRLIDTGSTLTDDDKHEASMGRDALSELYQVQDDDVGFFYVDGGEVYRYEGSDHRDSAPHTKALKQWEGTRVAGDETDMYFSGLSWFDGKERVENEVYYIYHRISRTTAVQVWRLETDDRPAIADGETLSFLVVGDEDNIANPRTPLHTTDFTVNTLENGTGTDLLIAEDSEQGTVTASGSAAFTIDDAGQDFTDWNNGKHVIRITDSSGDIIQAWIGTDDPDSDGTKVTLYKTSALTTKGYIVGGDSGFSEADTPLTYNVYNVTVELDSGFDGNFRLVKITNNSGSAGFITFSRLMADKGTASSKTAARAEDAQSQTDVGRRRKEHVTLHIDTFTTALNRAEKRVELRKLRKERLVLEMTNGTRANLMQIVHRQISDRINAVYSDMGITDSYFIERQTVEVLEGGLVVNCDWELQQADTAGFGFARFDQTNFA